AEPRSKARFADENAPRVHLQAAGCVSCGVRVHRANDAQIIGESRRVRKQAADFQAALAVFCKRKWRPHEMPNRPAIGADNWNVLALIGLAMMLGESRLGIKCIDMARSAVHEQKDSMLRLGRKLRLLRR